MSNHIFIEKIEYEKIYAHKDWDGVIGGGLILRIFDIPIFFLNRVKEAKRAIIIETPFSLEAFIEESLIIDHHDCRRGPLTEVRFGNIVICDETYESVTSLIADFFDLDIPDNILFALEDIESGRISENPLAEKMFLAYVSDLANFPYENIAKSVKNGDWKKILNWIERKSASKETKVVKQIAKIKVKNAEVLVDKVFLIKYNAEDPFEAGAARLALIQLQKNVKIGITLGYKGIYAFCGMIATKHKKINLYKLFKELSRANWDAGGRSDVGGFQIPYKLQIDQAVEILRETVSSFFKK